MINHTARNPVYYATLFTADVAVRVNGQGLRAGVRVGAAPSAAPRSVALGRLSAAPRRGAA